MAGFPILDELSEPIRQLDHNRAFAFGLFIFERAVPAYLRFQADTGWQDGGAIRAGLVQCWAAMEDPSLRTQEIVTISACERAIPDSEGNWDSKYTSAAIDAGDIACNLLEYLQEPDPDKIRACVTAQCDTIDLYVRNEESAALSGGLTTDKPRRELLEEECERLRDDMQFLMALHADRGKLFSLAMDRVLTLDYGRLRLL
jgi:hypothetical protein